MFELTILRNSKATRTLLAMMPPGLRYRLRTVFGYARGLLYAGWHVRILLRRKRKLHIGKKRILFVYGDITREELSYSLIVPQIANKYWVERMHSLEYPYYIPLFKPHLLVVPETYHKSARDMCSFARRKVDGIKILTMHGESTISAQAEAYWASGVLQDWEMVKGDRMKEILIRHGKNEESVFVCGNPRFDRYYHKTHIPREELCRQLGLDIKKKIVLYNTSFVLDDADLKKNFPHWVVEKYRWVRLHIPDAFLNIAKRHPDIQFMIKLHPTEIDDIYSRMVSEKEVNNCIVLSKRFNEEDVQIYDLLPNVDVVVHFTCTTSCEAWMCGKPTISCQFTPASELIADIIYGSEIVESEEQLETVILKFLENPRMSDEKLRLQQQFIEAWFYRIDGRSTDRVIEVIDRIMNGKIGASRDRIAY